MTRKTNKLILVSLLAGCGQVSGADDPDAGGNPAEGPSITAVAPERGALAGATDVVITGTGFTAQSQVIVGGLAAASVQVDSDTQLTITTPPGEVAEAPVDIIVFNDAGFASMPAAFRYNPLPAITSSSPPLGPSPGNTMVTITGSGFMANSAGTPTVEIGGVPLTSVTVVDDQTITGRTGAAGTIEAFVPLDVVVTNANGAATLLEAFRYTKPGLLAGGHGGSPGETRRTTLYYIDPADGSYLPVADLPTSISRLTLGADGSIYALSHRDDFGRETLVSLDSSTLEMTPIGRVKIGGTDESRPKSLELVDGTLFGIGNEEVLYQIDPETAVATQIGASLGTNRATCMAEANTTSVYLVENFSTGTVDTVNLTTALRTPGSALTPSTPTTTFCHGMTSIGGTLHALRWNRDGGRITTLVRINPGNGQVTDVATTLPEFRGLTLTPPAW